MLKLSYTNKHSFQFKKKSYCKDLIEYIFLHIFIYINIVLINKHTLLVLNRPLPLSETNIPNNLFMNFFRATAEDCLESSYFKEQPLRKFYMRVCPCRVYDLQLPGMSIQSCDDCVCMSVVFFSLYAYMS